jgi:hypothetical protein
MILRIAEEAINVVLKWLNLTIYDTKVFGVDNLRYEHDNHTVRLLD